MTCNRHSGSTIIHSEHELWHGGVLCQTSSNQPSMHYTCSSGGFANEKTLCVQALPPQAKLYRSTRVWSMYVDLVEALCTFEEARAVYDEMISLRVASAQVPSHHCVVAIAS